MGQAHRWCQPAAPEKRPFSLAASIDSPPTIARTSFAACPVLPGDPIAARPARVLPPTIRRSEEDGRQAMRDSSQESTCVRQSESLPSQARHTACTTPGWHCPSLMAQTRTAQEFRKTPVLRIFCRLLQEKTFREGVSTKSRHAARSMKMRGPCLAAKPSQRLQ